IRRLQDFARDGIKFVTGPDALPVGHYTRVVLANLSRDPAFGSDYSARVLRNLVSEEENVRSIAAKVQLGEADAAFVSRPHVPPALPRPVPVLTIPDAANLTASYPIAALKNAPQPEDARAFIALVLSAEGQSILARWGFVSVSAGRP